ncbi:MAG: tryptophan-rich sensory protein [Acidobacteria bacterium]|nr:tryptophan-rich sensory protein [Acidobacteriota bacterium]
MTDKIDFNGERRVERFVVVLATLCVVFVNYSAAKGYINGTTPQQVSDKYPSLLTPAGYAFSIWGLIYLGLIIFSIYQAMSSQAENARFKRIRALYIINCAANCAWIFLWHHEQIWASLAVIFTLLGTLVLINARLQNKRDAAETWAARVPFGLYFGWATVATVLNFTLALASSGVETSASTARISASVIVAAVTILGVVVRLKLSTAAYALAIAWALTAIAVKHGGETALVFCTAFGVIALLVAAIFPLSQTEKSNV